MGSVIIGTSGTSNKDDNRCNACYPKDLFHLSKFQRSNLATFDEIACLVMIFSSELINVESNSAESADIATEHVQIFIFEITFWMQPDCFLGHNTIAEVRRSIELFSYSRAKLSRTLPNH
jgi:hypothetical protein